MRFSVGAHYLGDHRCYFRVWSPLASGVEVLLLGAPKRSIPLRHTGAGYFEGEVQGVMPGALYRYRLDGSKERPDPASRAQVEGVHGPSQVVDPAFLWEDGCWFGLPLDAYIIYELHVGTFSAAGTFEAVIPRLAELKALGVTAVELMPIAQFPGDRNWGYDGVYPFAPQSSYGSALGLKRLINACHKLGLAAILDVVYNHLGPEGNYLSDFAPYFTERYKTPWGQAMNFDGGHSDEVRRYFIANALYWITDFHFDALRLDAVHAILDHSPFTFLEELADAVHRRAKELNRQIFLFPESAANDARLVRSRELGGYGHDAQWNDDFHHALHCVLSEEKSGYYQDYGGFWQLVKAYQEGFVYSGEYSQYRQRRHGASTRDIPAERFIVFAQNHDQVGNRMLGERLTRLVGFEELKLAAGAVLLSPFIPLLFMGEEYGEGAPFPYFISHGDAALVEAVRQGRRREFAGFGWQTEPPDPQDESAFLGAKLNYELRREGRSRMLWEFYRELIRLRRALGPLRRLSKEHCAVTGFDSERVLLLRRWNGGEEVVGLLSFNQSQVSLVLSLPAGQWHKAIDSAEPRWEGPGSPLPAKLDVDGSVTLIVPPKSCALFANDLLEAKSADGDDP